MFFTAANLQTQQNEHKNTYITTRYSKTINVTPNKTAKLFGRFIIKQQGQMIKAQDV